MKNFEKRLKSAKECKSAFVAESELMWLISDLIEDVATNDDSDEWDLLISGYYGDPLKYQAKSAWRWSAYYWCRDYNENKIRCDAEFGENSPYWDRIFYDPIRVIKGGYKNEEY